MGRRTKRKIQKYKMKITSIDDKEDLFAISDVVDYDIIEEFNKIDVETIEYIQCDVL